MRCLARPGNVAQGGASPPAPGQAVEAGAEAGVRGSLAGDHGAGPPSTGIVILEGYQAETDEKEPRVVAVALAEGFACRSRRNFVKVKVDQSKLPKGKRATWVPCGVDFGLPKVKLTATSATQLWPASLVRSLTQTELEEARATSEQRKKSRQQVKQKSPRGRSVSRKRKSPTPPSKEPGAKRKHYREAPAVAAKAVQEGLRRSRRVPMTGLQGAPP